MRRWSWVTRASGQGVGSLALTPPKTLALLRVCAACCHPLHACSLPQLTPRPTWPKLMASQMSPPNEALTLTTLSPGSILASVLPSVGSVRDTYAPPSLPRANLMPSGLLSVTCGSTGESCWWRKSCWSHRAVALAHSAHLVKRRLGLRLCHLRCGTHPGGTEHPAQCLSRQTSARDGQMGGSCREGGGRREAAGGGGAPVHQPRRVAAIQIITLRGGRVARGGFATSGARASAAGAPPTTAARVSPTDTFMVGNTKTTNGVPGGPTAGRVRPLYNVVPGPALHPKGQRPPGHLP